MTASKHASSSSARGCRLSAYLLSPFASWLIFFPLLALHENRILESSGSIPYPIHVSFFESWPIISFFSALSAAIWFTFDVGFWSSTRIGGVADRVIVDLCHDKIKGEVE